jgi:hypothetical protein
VLQTCRERARPVVLTAVSAILGVLPIALGLGLELFHHEVTIGAPSTQWWMSMSSAIVWGLAFATLLTLVVTPAAADGVHPREPPMGAWREVRRRPRVRHARRSKGQEENHLVPRGESTVRTEPFASMPLRKARARLRLPSRRTGFRLAALAGASLMAVAIAMLALGSHSPQPDEIAALGADETQSAETATENPQVATVDADAVLPRVEEAMLIETRTGTIVDPGEERWASTNAVSAAAASRNLERLLTSSPREGLPGRADFAAPSDRGVDPIETAALPVRETGEAARVAVAESETEVAELEERLASNGGEAFAVAALDSSGSLDADATEFGGDAPMASVTAHVNLRAGPDNEAEILRVVPENADVALLDGCPNWCEVEHEGVRGYIFGSFIDRDVSAETLDTMQ